MKNPLVERATDFLRQVYDPHRALFPFTTRLSGGRYVSSFDGGSTIRYSINCLLGLRQAARSGANGFALEAERLTDAFIDRHRDELTNPGDLGLLLVLLADRFEGGLGSEALRQIDELRLRREVRRIPLQEVCWMLWGAVALSREGVPRAEETARDLYRQLHTEFFDRDSLLPRHTNRLYRRNSVSFGGVAYFLRALHEYAAHFDDEYAATLFRFGVQRILALQGPRGEWPWMIDVNAAAAIDLFPVYSVHQDSMAMLFLLPAFDMGIPGTAESIERSYAWVLGSNGVGAPMLVEDPFFRFRSLERFGAFQRPRRYLRSLPGISAISRRTASRTWGIHVNTECRSYEMGWVVYVWSGRPERLALRADGLGGPAIRFGQCHA